MMNYLIISKTCLNGGDRTVTHLRYKATDNSFDIDLHLEGMNEEETHFWSAWLQLITIQWMKLFNRVPEALKEKKQ